jgi:hypothetical protein
VKTHGAHRGKPAASGRIISGLAALSIVCVTVAFLAVPSDAGATRDRSSDPQQAARSSGDEALSQAEPARRAGVASERPREARLPSGKVVPIRAVSTRPNGTLAVPGDVRVSGWWRGGSRIGDPFGSTLLAAHVDSYTQGLGPYAELLTVRAGQSIVLSSAHLEQEFTITSLRLVAKGALSSTPWIYSPSGSRRVVMVTCAGPYRPSEGGYQRLAVVTARPVASPSRRTA